MFKKSLVFGVGLLFWVGFCVVGYAFEGEGTYFTAVNMRVHEGNEISSTNYLSGHILPLGTEVKVLKVKGRLIVFEKDSVKYTFQKTRHSRLSIDSLFDRYFDKDKQEIEGKLSALSSYEQKMVAKGALEYGMSRDAVMLSCGYPPSHRTADLNNNNWYYWKDHMMTVLFINDKVARVFDHENEITNRAGYLKSFIGKTKREIIMELGVANRIESDGADGEVLVYEKHHSDSVQRKVSIRPGRIRVSKTEGPSVSQNMFYIDSKGMVYHVMCKDL